MDILEEPHSFTERDLKFGHFHVFDRFQIFAMLNKLNFQIYTWEGIILKPFPNNKMLELYKENFKIIEALYKVGKELPDYCAEIYVNCKPV
jgi:hypothetical protein